MKTPLLAISLFFSVPSYANPQTAAPKPSQKVIEHKVEGDETAWFLAQIYFGQGKRNTEILSFNRLKASDFKPGLVVKIPAPKYSPNQKDFATRVADLKSKRSREIGLLTYVPAAQVTQLPFRDRREPHKTPQERARDEVRLRTSEAE